MNNKKIKFIPESNLANSVGTAPLPSLKTIPEWYKKISLHINNEKKIRLIRHTTNSTVKGCSPFLDSLTAGYTYTLNDDLLVTWVEGFPNFNWRTQREMISFHDFEQSSTMAVPKGYYKGVIKWQNDFGISLPKGYSLWVTHPSNRFDLPFITLNGFVDADKYDMAIQFPFFIQEGFEGIIEAGTPVAQLIPMKRDNWESNVEKFEENKILSKYEKYRSKIIKSYKHSYWTKKSYN